MDAQVKTFLSATLDEENPMSRLRGNALVLNKVRDIVFRDDVVESVQPFSK
jgi:hypothetical protein